MLNFPPELPICEHREEIEEAIRKNQVVIVCGDTGSGKTTQLPKMALELGRGSNGKRIACTQPRRLAAITVATRVAEEFGEKPGGVIGYQHRFEKRVSNDTRVKFMTDGVLLAETRSDPFLNAYDTIIIDEAHERSLNIDFLLGILKRILHKRKDLKVIVSSATLDSALFSEFFGNAPALSIPGRLFPIEMRYREPPEGEETDVARDVAAAVDELPPEGDILVFLPGERDIRETAEELARTNPAGDDIIPLLASLPASEQQRAFRKSGRRRIILATNVAETSVTIPGIRYVIDSGLARISRYIHRTQVQRLQIEPISQASARQRAGRCGRLGPGVCIRLYSEADFLARDEYTPPEILRSSLAGVILTMLDLRLGDIEHFPFISPPEGPMIREGLRELLELGAIAPRNRSAAAEAKRREAGNSSAGESDSSASAAPRGHGAGEGGVRLTSVGHALARIPVEPRLARMLLAADKEKSLCDVLTIVAALSCDDPRRRPVDDREKADQAHARFRAPDSDFAGTLKMWRWWEQETAESSQNQARKLCKANYLSYPKMREWRDLRTQLEGLCKRLGFDIASVSGGNDGIHRALLSGLLGRIGFYDSEKRDYRGAHGVRFAAFPGSVLFKKPPQWIMAGELVDTSRLYAREAAVLNPEWIEPVAGPLCRHTFTFPEWDSMHGFVRATEQVSLYGLVVVQGRRCDYSRIAPAECREIFIRRGLIDCEFPKAPNIVRDNIAVISAVRRQEEKTRRPGLLDVERLYAFFDKAFPADINNADALRRWLRHASAEEAAAFRLKKEDWLPSNPVSTADFPESIQIGGAKMALFYRHTIDDEDDGITCTALKSDAHLLREWRSDWLVPGALPEKLRWMIGCLPSAQRRVLAPAEETVARLMTYLKPGQEPLAEALSATLQREWGIPVYSTAWDAIRMPVHFQVKFRVRDNESGKIIASGRNLEEVLKHAGVDAEKEKKPADVRRTAGRQEYSFVRDGMKKWECGVLPEHVESGKAGWAITQYPALHDDGASVSVKLYSDPVKAAKIHRQGLARLFTFATDLSRTPPVLSQKSRILRPLPIQAAMYLKQIEYGEPKFTDDFVMAVAIEAFAKGGDVRDAGGFARACGECSAAMGAVRSELSLLLFNIITLAAEVSRLLEEVPYVSDATYEAMESQLAWLVFPGFVRNVRLEHLRCYVRYLEAMRVRIDRSARNASADAAREVQVKEFWERYHSAVTGANKPAYNEDALSDFRWMIEEFRVSLFAQELHTPYPVSAKRLEAQWAKRQ